MKGSVYFRKNETITVSVVHSIITMSSETRQFEGTRFSNWTQRTGSIITLSSEASRVLVPR